MASKTEERRIKIIADGTSVNASMEKISSMARLLRSDLNKLPVGTQAWIDKAEELKKAEARLNEARTAARNVGEQIDEAAAAQKRYIEIVADGKKVNASYNQVKASVTALEEKVRDLAPGSDEFIEATKDLVHAKKRLKDVEDQTQKTEKSFRELREEAFQASPLGPMFNTINGFIAKGTSSLNVLTSSFGKLRVAIAATGIGLLVIALGTLINYLTTTQDGIDKVNKVLTPMRVIFEKLQGVVQNLGGNLFKGLGELLNGEVSTGLKTVWNGAKQAGEELGTAFTEGIEQGGRLAQMNIDIEKSENALIVKRAELAKQYKEASEIAENVAASEEDRRKAAQLAIDVTNEGLRLEQELIDQKIARKELENSLNDTSRADDAELQELLAQRIQFETQASEARTTARSKLNTVNQSIAAEDKKRHEEALKRMDEEQKKEEEAQKRRIELRKQYEQAERELVQSLEDIRIAAMEEGFEKEKAQLDLQLQRELEALEAKKQAVLNNEVVTQEERLAIEEQFAELARMKQAERDEAVKEAQAEQREADIEERLAQFDEDQEREILLLENSMIGAMDAEFRKKEALLQIQREYAMEKLAILEAAGEGETNQALKLKNVIAQIDKDIADEKISNEERVKNAKQMLQDIQLEAAKEFLALGIDLMNEDAKARKAFVSAYKAIQIGQIIDGGIKEVQAIWENNAKNPMNALIPGFGQALSVAQTALAVARTAGAVNRIRTTKYATGGSTGSGRVIDMVMDSAGTWRMPNGQSVKNVGSFAKGGHIRSASLGAIGEAGSEWVGPNWMIRSPKYANIFGYLEAERRRATPFATGGMTASAPPQIPQNSSATADLQQFMAMIEQFGQMKMVMMEIRDLLGEWPSTLRVVNDPRDILDGVRVLNEIEADSRINR
jgi:hypothetical protein